jgi:hypothetical protein
MDVVTAIAWPVSAVFAAVIGAAVSPWIQHRLRSREMRAREQREMIEEWLDLARFKCSAPSIVLFRVEKGHDPREAAGEACAAFAQSALQRVVRWPLDPARVADKTLRELSGELNEVTNGLTVAMLGLAKGGSPQTFAKAARNGIDRANRLREMIIEQMLRLGW